MTSHTANSSQCYHVWCHLCITKPRRVLTCSCRRGQHGWNASEGVSLYLLSRKPPRCRLQLSWNCAQGREPVPDVWIYNFIDVLWPAVPLLPLYCVLTWNSAAREGFTFHSCLFHFQTQTSVWIKAINNLLHVLHCSLITVTPFLCSLKLHCSRGFLSSLAPSLLPNPVSFFSGRGRNLENSFQWPHQTLQSHALFFLPVLLLNKELQFEWGKRERAKGAGLRVK